MKKKNNYLSRIGSFILSILGLITLVIMISFAVRSLPSISGSSYPGPNENVPSPEFKEKSSTNPVKPEPTHATQITPSNCSPIFNISTGVGKIIESGYSPYSSNYYFVNQWYAEIGDWQIMAYAGALKNDPSIGDKELDKPWPGVIILEVRDREGKMIEEASGEFRVLNRSGPLRILTADEAKIYLVSSDGTPYTFGLQSHDFIIEDPKMLLTRQIGNGTIVENGRVPFPSGGYIFENYWWGDQKNQRVYIFSGVESQDLSEGVLVKLVVDSDSNSIEGLVYPIPVQSGSVRIVEIVDGKVVVATIGGLAFAFDVESGQFYKVVCGAINTSADGVIYVSPIPYDQEVSFEGNATPTIVPTYTPLPTLRPF